MRTAFRSFGIPVCGRYGGSRVGRASCLECFGEVRRLFFRRKREETPLACAFRCGRPLCSLRQAVGLRSSGTKIRVSGTIRMRRTGFPAGTGDPAFSTDDRRFDERSFRDRSPEPGRFRSRWRRRFRSVCCRARRKLGPAQEHRYRKRSPAVPCRTSCRRATLSVFCAVSCAVRSRGTDRVPAFARSARVRPNTVSAFPVSRCFGGNEKERFPNGGTAPFQSRMLIIRSSSRACQPLRRTGWPAACCRASCTMRPTGLRCRRTCGRFRGRRCCRWAR